MQVNVKEIKKLNFNALIMCVLYLQVFFPFKH